MSDVTHTDIIQWFLISIDAICYLLLLYTIFESDPSFLPKVGASETSKVGLNMVSAYQEQDIHQ